MHLPLVNPCKGGDDCVCVIIISSQYPIWVASSGVEREAGKVCGWNCCYAALASRVSESIPNWIHDSSHLGREGEDCHCVLVLKFHGERTCSQPNIAKRTKVPVPSRAKWDNSCVLLVHGCSRCPRGNNFEGESPFSSSLCYSTGPSAYKMAVPMLKAGLSFG